MSAEDTTTELPWRKRHPVVSRLFLYVLGVGLTALLVHLFLERQETDERDRREALAKELDGLGAVLVIDPDGAQVLKILDEKFADPTLPVKTRGRALRWRALALRKGNDHAGAEAALEQAGALELDEAERAALLLEWAELKLEAGDPQAAMVILIDAPIPAGPVPLDLLRSLLMARAEKAADQQKEGLGSLRHQLAELRTPLDPDARAYVGGREWTAAQLATVATEGLVRLGGADRPVEAWRRLARLAPRDFEAQLVCARGLMAAGLEDEARAAFEAARRQDARLADAEANKDPSLAPFRR